MRVLLLNDTENVYHWGSYGTSHAIKVQLRQKGATEIDCSSVRETRRMRRVPETCEDFGTERTFAQQQLMMAAKLAACDAVVINGEGTIHGFRNGPRALLYLAYAAKHFYGKPVMLINHACYPKYPRPEVIAYYQAGYRSCDYVAARDGRSTQTIRDALGVPCVQAFDSLPLAIQEVEADIPAAAVDRPYICLAGATNYSPAQSPAIARALQSAFPDHAYVFLGGTAWGGRLLGDRLALWSMKRSLPGLQGLDAQSFPAWLAVIKHADLLLSGRFHYAVAAACLGTPAVSFQSNTPKIESMMEDLGLPGAVP
ncbi:MAG: polysaccharide pyruvyl transferase family protein, partial [Armatimonadetes bacterium]|nr:polysaccharide pyruvyl transferase family protein [Armatimonadota bacterium]